MSLNIIFQAHREIQVVRTGARDIQGTYFEVWQTPTDVSFRIGNAADPAAEYKAWVMEQSDCVFEQDVFGEDDVLCEHPIGTEVVDPRKHHLEEFSAWIAEMSVGGWTVTAIVI